MTRRQPKTSVRTSEPAATPAPDWKDLLAALWVVGIVAVFLLQLLAALAQALGL